LLDIITIETTIKKNPAKLDQLASDNFSFSTVTNVHVEISYTPKSMNWPWKIRDGIFMEGNLSAARIMHYIDALIGEYQVPKSSFFVSIVAKAPVQED